MVKSPFFQKYLLPGFVYQSVVIAGGYGTGRELVEFFLSSGPLPGLLAMVVSMLVFSAVCAATFAFAQTFQCYDYRTLFKHLLGRGWFLYEIIYFAMLLLILAVIAAAAGAILRENLLAAIRRRGHRRHGGGRLSDFSGHGNHRAVSGANGSFVLYGVYVVFFVWCVARFGGQIATNLSTGGIGLGWIGDGIRYAGYNLSSVPPILFVMRHGQTKRDAIIAGGLAGPIVIIPAILFYFCMVSQYPEILDRPVPANYLLDILGSRAFQLTFQIVLFGTLIETGTCMIHGVNERIAGVYAERNRTMPTRLRPAIAIGLLTIGALLAQFGLIDLIARGYGTMTFFFLLIYALPIVTLGVWKITGGRDAARATG